jgi:hypothetical protein
MAFALQCLQANRQAFVVSQQTNIGACAKSVLRVQGGLVNHTFSPCQILSKMLLVGLFNVRYIDSEPLPSVTLGQSILLSADPLPDR